jgi:hypothetical protein
LVLKNLKNLKITQKIKIMIRIAKIGKKMDNADNPIEVPVSKDEISGLATPAVIPVDVKREVVVEAFMAVAVPPPAMMASAQVNMGSKFATVDTITNVPANVANGIIIVSNK